MDTSKESKHISGRKTRADRKIEGKISITRKQFHALVKKSAQPIKNVSESDSTSDET